MVVEEYNKNDIEESMPELWILLSAEQRNYLFANTKLLQFCKNEIIYKEADSPEFVYCLIKGKVKVFKNGASGRTQIVRFIRPRGMFGYRAAFASENYMTGASAFEDSTLCCFPIEVMKNIVVENNKVAIFFIKQLASMLGDADLLTVNLTQKHIRARVADSLLAMKDTYGVERDGMTLCIHTSREDLANTCSMTTNNAIRTLSALAAEKVIGLEGKKIKILDERQLQTIAQKG
ncbi:MAG: Crp/Fnr family transcriptional regulator [Prevotella sp.]